MPEVFYWEEIALLPKQYNFVEADTLEEAIELLAYRATKNVMKIPESEQQEFYIKLKSELTQKPPRKFTEDEWQRIREFLESLTGKKSSTPWESKNA